MSYISAYVNPQAVITHSESREEAFFIKAIKQKADDFDLTYIPLSRPAADMTWLSKLDSRSLKGMA
jgi:hypothetical protein